MLAVCSSLVDILAQEQPDESSYTEQELYDLSLEELLNVKVTTASKTEETVRDAPGVVSVITTKEIESYGATNLAEVLDRVAGIYMTSSFLVENNLPSIRGETNAHWATKVLVLIDGRPYRESFLGGNITNVLNGFPLTIVDRVEVIRGPGSVLYGTNAFMGVINVILKKSSQTNFTVSSRYGSFNTHQTNISTGIRHNDFSIDASLNLYNSDGWKYTARDEAAIIRSNTTPIYDSIISPARTILKDRDDLGAALHGTYKGFTLSAFYGASYWQSMDKSGRWLVPEDNNPNAKPIRSEFYTDKLFADLGYEKKINRFYTTSMNVTWNWLSMGDMREDYKNATTAVDNGLLAEWTNNIRIGDNLDFIAGFVINNQQGHLLDKTSNADGTPYPDNTGTENPGGYYIIPHWDETWYSGYTQWAYKPISILKIVGGVQANKVEGVDWHYSPRIAAILQATSGFGGKLLHGSAFRSATPGGEKKFYIPGVLRGNRQLLPEAVNTSEIQLFVVKKKLEASINYFYSETSNLIVRSRKDDPNNVLPGTPQYINSDGKIKSQGIEAETKFYINLQWSGMASISTQNSEDSEGRKNYSGAPLHMAKVGIRYNGPRGVDVAVFNTYYSKGGNIRAIFSADNTPENFAGTATDANPPMKAVNYMTVNVQLNLPEFLRKPSMADISVFCYMVNLLGQKVNYPEFVRRGVNAIPGRAGFNIHGGVKIKL
ncbi:hypothetical protein GCM10009122_60350 [Fulvivirga kasyanovii]